MTAPGRTFLTRLFAPKRRSRKNNRGPVEGLKTLGFVVPLTILIWVYAERAQTRQERDFKVRLGFTTPNTGTAAIVTDATDSVALTLEGPSGQIEQFKRNAADASHEGRLMLPVPTGDTSPGRKTWAVASAIRSDPRFSGLNLTVTSSPADVHATVDPIVSRDVAVGPPQGLTVNLRNVTFNPSRVTVTGPQTLVNAEFAGDAPTIAVDANSVDTSASTGPRTKVVSLSQKAGVTISQPQVSMTYEVGSTISEGEIRTVYIDVRRPISDDGRSKVLIHGTGGPVIHNVRVSGPANIVSRLVGDSPELPVKAVLPITKEDVDKGELRRAVDLDLKEGVTPLGGPYEVTFEVRSIASDADR